MSGRMEKAIVVSLSRFRRRTNDLSPYHYVNWKAVAIGIKANNKVLEISFHLNLQKCILWMKNQ
nr:hypothetical protein [Elizabethkingia sp. ASV34]